MDPLFYDQLMRTGFGHRSTVREGEGVAYTLSNRSGEVLLPFADWQRLGDEYASRTRDVRKTVLKTVLLLPFGILFFALFLARAFPHPVALSLIILGLFSWAGSWLFWYPFRIRQITREMEGRLVQYPRTHASKRNPARQPRLLQILCMILVGPHLLVSAYGEIGGPDTFRNTPWVGRDFGTGEWIALAIMILFLSWPYAVNFVKEKLDATAR